MSIEGFIKNIFSITDYGETHHLLKLCGLKIKFPKREYAQKRKENPYYYYKKNNIDITTIPPATGQIREVQLGKLAIKEFDKICRANNLKYWLDFGMFLGAIRHKGLDYCFAEPVWVYSYDTIFPLKNLEFEGHEFNVVNKPEEYLSEIFGDNMAYPKKLALDTVHI